jgi:hypothetical protein
MLLKIQKQTYQFSCSYRPNMLVMVFHASLPDLGQELEYGVQHDSAHTGGSSERIALYQSGDNLGSLFFRQAIHNEVILY